MDKRKVIKIQLLFFIIVFFVVIAYFLSRENNNVFSILAEQSKNAIYSNIETGFYNEDIKINLTKDKLLPYGSKIFYTTNGEDPDKYSKEYSKEINISCDENEKVVPLKVVAYYKGKYSKIQEFTYVLCKTIDERFNMPIISITTNRENLYDFDKGLFVPGTIYENAIREYDDDDYVYQTILNGNYRERNDGNWIRKAELVMFDDKGKTFNEKKIGISISGGTSSAQFPKSLKLISNYQDESEQFEIKFLDTSKQSNNSIIDYYNTIRLRSGTQSGVGGNIRSTLVSELANEVGFDGCFLSKIVLVYLNGDFYGIMDMEQNYSDSFLKNKFNLESVDKVFKIKGNEKDCFKESGLNTLFECDLNKEENQKKLEEKVDVENYIEYYAINFCINNTDWPQNNYELWYYTGDKDENNKYTDGRARFLMYDMDMIFRPESAGEWGEDVLTRLLKDKVDEFPTGFEKMMKVKKYRDLFITIMSNLQKKSFNPDNINKKIDSIKEYMKNEADIQFKTTGWIDELERESSTIKQINKKVYQQISADLADIFDLDEKYSFVLNNSKGVTAKIVNQVISESEVYKNEYFKNTEFKVSLQANPGYKIDLVIINGQVVDYDKNSNTFVISDKYLKDKKIEVNITSKKEKETKLIISEISAKDYNDWIKFTNIGEEEISLKDYYISNEEDNLRRYNLPNINLKPGETFIIDGKSNKFNVGDYICNFTFSKYKTIYLSREDKIVDKVYIPKMQANESYGRVNNSSIWNFFENDNNKRRK